MDKCHCLKIDGQPCTRKTINKPGFNKKYCWQHQKCLKPQLETKSNKVNNKLMQDINFLNSIASYYSYSPTYNSDLLADLLDSRDSSEFEDLLRILNLRKPSDRTQYTKFSQNVMQKAEFMAKNIITFKNIQLIYKWEDFDGKKSKDIITLSKDEGIRCQDLLSATSIFSINYIGSPGQFELINETDNLITIQVYIDNFTT